MSSPKSAWDPDGAGGTGSHAQRRLKQPLGRLPQPGGFSQLSSAQVRGAADSVVVAEVLTTTEQRSKTKDRYAMDRVRATETGRVRGSMAESMRRRSSMGATALEEGVQDALDSPPAPHAQHDAGAGDNYASGVPRVAVKQTATSIARMRARGNGAAAKGGSPGGSTRSSPRAVYAVDLDGRPVDPAEEKKRQEETKMIVEQRKAQKAVRLPSDVAAAPRQAKPSLRQLEAELNSNRKALTELTAHLKTAQDSLRQAKHHSQRKERSIEQATQKLAHLMKLLRQLLVVREKDRLSRIARHVEHSMVMEEDPIDEETSEALGASDDDRSNNGETAAAQPVRRRASINMGIGTGVVAGGGDADGLGGVSGGGGGDGPGSRPGSADSMELEAQHHDNIKDHVLHSLDILQRNIQAALAMRKLEDEFDNETLVTGDMSVDMDNLLSAAADAIDEHDSAEHDIAAAMREAHQAVHTRSRTRKRKEGDVVNPLRRRSVTGDIASQHLSLDNPDEAVAALVDDDEDEDEEDNRQAAAASRGDAVQAMQSSSGSGSGAAPGFVSSSSSRPENIRPSFGNTSRNALNAPHATTVGSNAASSTTENPARARSGPAGAGQLFGTKPR